MPNIQSAKKKQRKDIKRSKQNKSYLRAVQSAMKSVQKKKDVKSAQLIGNIFSIIDKAAKKKVIHKNKAARLLKINRTTLIEKMRKIHGERKRSLRRLRRNIDPGF